MHVQPACCHIVCIMAQKYKVNKIGWNELLRVSKQLNIYKATTPSRSSNLQLPYWGQYFRWHIVYRFARQNFIILQQFLQCIRAPRRGFDSLIFKRWNQESVLGLMFLVSMPHWKYPERWTLPDVFINFEYFDYWWPKQRKCSSVMVSLQLSTDAVVSAQTRNRRIHTKNWERNHTGKVAGGEQVALSSTAHGRNFCQARRIRECGWMLLPIFRCRKVLRTMEKNFHMQNFVKFDQMSSEFLV